MDGKNDPFFYLTLVFSPHPTMRVGYISLNIQADFVTIQYYNNWQYGMCQIGHFASYPFYLINKRLKESTIARINRFIKDEPELKVGDEPMRNRLCKQWAI